MASVILVIGQEVEPALEGLDAQFVGDGVWAVRGSKESDVRSRLTARHPGDTNVSVLKITGIGAYRTGFSDTENNVIGEAFPQAGSFDW
jgi:hypothetical protein